MSSLLTCISCNSKSAAKLIRRSSRLASFYNSKWFVIYVETTDDSSSKISSADKRHLINNFKLAVELGAEVITLNNKDKAKAVSEFAVKKEVGLIVLGTPLLSWREKLIYGNFLKDLTKHISNLDIDILMISKYEKD
jgi:two-component system sensor histidine kinase KdpD